MTIIVINVFFSAMFTRQDVDVEWTVNACVAFRRIRVSGEQTFLYRPDTHKHSVPTITAYRAVAASLLL